MLLLGSGVVLKARVASIPVPRESHLDHFCRSNSRVFRHPDENVDALALLGPRLGRRSRTMTVRRDPPSGHAAPHGHWPAGSDRSALQRSC